MIHGSKDPYLCISDLPVILDFISFLLENGTPFTQFYIQFREFCAMVRKIYIYPKEEIQKMSPGTLGSTNEENQSASET